MTEPLGPDALEPSRSARPIPNRPEDVSADRSSTLAIEDETLPPLLFGAAERREAEQVPCERPHRNLRQVDGASGKSSKGKGKGK